MVDAVKESDRIEVSKKEVSCTLKQSCDMRFHKVKRVPFQGNSQRSLVVRQQCASKMLDLLGKGYTIVNIDESWLNELDFQRRKWHDRTESNSMPKQSVSPRLSIIAAIDT